MANSISVLITNYNYGKFLGDSIGSVVAQTRDADEIVVVDDGSTDDSRHRLETEFADTVRLVSKANGGQASAFNAGLAACSGDIVCLLDADDRWHPEKLARVEAAFALQPDAALLRHDMRYEQHGGPQDGKNVLGLQDTVWPVLPLRRALVDRRVGVTSATAFPRWVLEELLPMPEEAFRICADRYLCVLAPTLGPAIDLAAPLADYRIHGANGWAGSGSAASDWVLSTNIALIRLLEEQGCDPIIPHYVYRQIRRGSGTVNDDDVVRRRRRLRRAADSAHGPYPLVKRAGHAAAELFS